MTYSSIPIWLVDMTGSFMMILLSFMCLKVASKLRRGEPGNIIWAYLLWICYAFAVFAVSRSAGHILKQVLLLNSREYIWATISPVSGAVNTFTFAVVGAFTLFFERTWKIYQTIIRDKKELQSTHAELIYLNQNLEAMVSERTRALTSSEQKYRRIFEASKDMILIADKQGVMIDLNPTGGAMLGIPGNPGRDQVAGSRVQDFLAGPEEWDTMAAALVRRGYLAGEEFDLRLKNGSTTRVLLSGSTVSEAGQPATLHFVIKDIERQHQMKEQMAQADKLASIGELSSGIAHEINNPLNVILGYTQLLLRHERKDSERFADLKTIEKHVRNCKTIVEDLLSFSRKSETLKEMMDLNAVLDDALMFIRHHSDLDRIRILTDYSPQVVRLMMDGKKIKQVMINLIMNAIHAVDGHGTIRVSTNRDEDARLVRVQIADDGYGIETKNLPKIFDPFFTTKPTGEGTGLGLSVSYGIIRDHGGKITVDSQSGKGSMFTVVLPLLSGS